MEPIVARETIRDLARAAAERGQSVHAVNPYPPGTVAHSHFERDYRVAVQKVEKSDMASRLSFCPKNLQERTAKHAPETLHYPAA